MLHKGTYRIFFVITDIAAASVSWVLFFLYRKYFIESEIFGIPVPFHADAKFYLGIAFSVVFWFLLYYSTGFYQNVLRKSMVENFTITIVTSFTGVLIIFFSLILDDTIGSYKNYYKSFLALFLLQSLLTFLSRMGVTGFIQQQVKKGKIIFQSLVIGKSHKIDAALAELEEKHPYHGRRFLGMIPVDGAGIGHHHKLEVVGTKNDIHHFIVSHSIDDVLIILEESDEELYKEIITSLNHASFELFVNTEMYPVVKGKIEVNSLFREPFFKVSRDLLQPTQRVIKQMADVFGSAAGLALALPFMVPIAVLIKLTSKGPLFYSHERVGRHGKPFRIYKFRSMYLWAEDEGPQLAKKGDPRITPVGRFMRRLRIDEIPNLYNVLKGDMSLVGPRPERQFYIDQIVKVAPKYHLLLQVKPGVTSLGQVKYGYAENVDEMVRRMKYDLLYLENMSVYTDFVILARTIVTLLKGRGV